MNYGPLVFLAAFFALATSWVGFVLTPQLQVGQLQQTNTLGNATAYPLARPGLAQEGRDVYRACGCAACHSQQVGQMGTIFEVSLTDAGTNRTATQAALKQVAGLSDADLAQALEHLPRTVLRGVTKEAAEKAARALNASGAKAQLSVVPVGPDIARGWGKRRSVAEDYLFDYPVMLGSQRIGPDLANVGVRLPDAAWHLRHLYEPRSEVKGSTMPPHRFLFERRKVRGSRAADALFVPGIPEGYELVPTTEARALAAYLVSLRADAPLFAAPLTVAGATSGTNMAGALNATVTNAVPTNNPAK